MKRALTVAGVVTVLIVAGCTSSTPTPTTTQAPTSPASSVVSTTTKITPSPSASRASATAYESPDPAKVAEAEQVFRDFQAAFFAAEVRGGSATLPADIAPLVAPPISANTQQLLAQQKLEGWKAAPSPAPTVRFSGVLPNKKIGDSDFAIGACVDGTKTPILEGGRRVQFGVAADYVAYFKSVQGAIRYVNAETKQVSSC